jgi:hypothetical protein
MEAMPSVFAAPEASCLAYVVLGTLRLGQSLPPGRGNLTLVSAPAPHFPGAGAFATRCYRCAEHPVTPLRLSQEPAISRGGASERVDLVDRLGCTAAIGLVMGQRSCGRLRKITDGIRSTALHSTKTSSCR